MVRENFGATKKPKENGEQLGVVIHLPIFACDILDPGVYPPSLLD